MAGPGIPVGKRVKSNCGLVDILPTLVEMAAGPHWNGYPDQPDGKSLIPLFTKEDPQRVAISEIFSEGVAAPYVMYRKGQYKFNYVEHDPAQLFDMEADPDELNDLAKDPKNAALVAKFLAEVHTRWDFKRIEAEVLVSQRRRRFVYQALMKGSVTPWDYQPMEDASKRYYRGMTSYHEAEGRDLLRP